MSTYSPSLRVELITSGDQAGTWGNTTNDNFAYIFDAAIAGYQTVSVTSANQAFTYNNGPVSTASLNQSVYAMLRLTTTTGAAFNVYAPPVSKQYVIWNNSGQAATIFNWTTISPLTAAGTGITIANGDRVLVWSDGTNFYEVKGGNVTGIVAVVNGGTGASDASGARTNLGLGTMAIQNANAVAITGGSITGITDLAVADGGTGASDASGARTNLGLVIGTNVPSPTGTGASGTWNISISGNAATATSATSATNATNPASGGSFITSLNIGSQSVNFATNATNAVNATNATNPASGGSFITSLNIGSQSVNFANSATNATNATNATTAATVSTTISSGAVATTQAAGDNSTKVATTAYVQTAAPGIRGQAFTSNGTFTIPTGVTALKITVVGGGGGGAGGYDFGCAGVVPASGGSGAGTAIVYFSGLTPGNTILVTVGGAGTGGASGSNGGTGGNSSIASGTQTITTVTASGGGRGIYNNLGDGPGNTTNATLGITGQLSVYGFPYTGGGSLFGFPGFVVNNVTKQAASGYGAGGAGDNGSNRAGLAGTAGFVFFEY